jgi:hypothetical protein
MKASAILVCAPPACLQQYGGPKSEVNSVEVSAVVEGEGVDDVGERMGDTRSEPADALGAEGSGAGCIADADREPVGPVAVDQGDAEDGEQRSRDRCRGATTSQSTVALQPISDAGDE